MTVKKITIEFKLIQNVILLPNSNQRCFNCLAQRPDIYLEQQKCDSEYLTQQTFPGLQDSG